MRSWESVRRSSDGRHGLPRSHGPLSERNKVELRLTSCGGWPADVVSAGDSRWLPRAVPASASGTGATLRPGSLDRSLADGADGLIGCDSAGGGGRAGGSRPRSRARPVCRRGSIQECALFGRGRQLAAMLEVGDAHADQAGAEHARRGEHARLADARRLVDRLALGGAPLSGGDVAGGRLAVPATAAAEQQVVYTGGAEE